MINIGQNIRDELTRQDRTVYWLAKKLGVNRSVLYRTFEKNSIDTLLLQRISNILGRNFFLDFMQKEEPDGDAVQ